MHITVLICTHNRLELLKKTIESLNKAIQQVNDTVDILVVANACTDNTLTWLKQYSNQKQQLPISFLSEPSSGKSHALNKGLSHLNCDLVAFIDDDHRVDSLFFESISLIATKYPLITVFCGRIIPDWDGTEPSWVHEQGTYKIYPPPIPIYDQGLSEMLIGSDTNQPGGGNLFIRLNALKNIGEFSTTLGPNGHNFVGGEDTDFLQRAKNQGENILYTPTILQYHHVDYERLKLINLLKLAYHRSRCIIEINKTPHSNKSMPLYMWRKLFKYFVELCSVYEIYKVRFYLIRIASTLGEMRALIKITRE